MDETSNGNVLMNTGEDFAMFWATRTRWGKVIMFLFPNNSWVIWKKSGTDNSF
ncbi:MAG: hypothetical protein QNJ55_30445 [Xenococcus sp. MO_188.B8]|nr:hypothetical protein [Xenococcus sp. MO_188.B8]